MPGIVAISGVKPYDGRYPLDLRDDLTIREWGWVKRLSGILPLKFLDGLEGGDQELYGVLAVIALYRAGKVESGDATDLYERLQDMPGVKITLDLDAEPEEDDAGPPALSSNGNNGSSGADSTTSSESWDEAPTVIGTAASATSASPLPRSGI